MTCRGLFLFCMTRMAISDRIESDYVRIPLTAAQTKDAVKNMT